MEAMVLAGGLGTRLRSAVKDLPKPMASINGIPFLSYILDHLSNNEIDKVILAIGYKSEEIIRFYGDSYRGMEIVYSVEEDLLGTGGAIKLASKHIEDEKFFILNGDTWNPVDLNSMILFHNKRDADISIAIKKVNDCDRYGLLVCDNKNRVVRFKEKEICGSGFINGGVYCVNSDLFKKLNISDKVFSWEKKVLENSRQLINVFGFLADNEFIDIGIPEDYNYAKQILPSINS